MLGTVTSIQRTAMAALLAAGLLAGCSSNDGKPYVEYENSSMDRYLEVGEPKTRRKFDMLQFSVDLTNKTKSPLKFQYKFKFFDEDKFEVAKDGRPWTPVTLSAKETTAVQVTAPNASVIGAKIYIKEQ